MITNVTLRNGRIEDLEKILIYLIEFGLDRENIEAEQFLVAEVNGNMAGFGRIKQYKEIFELSSVGVIHEYRKNGIGKVIVEKLIENFPTNDVWITTKIPEYFAQFGFQEIETPPDELKCKTERICARVCGSIENSKFMLYKK